MPGSQTFKFSAAEAKRMQRGVFALPVLILPFALILGLEEGKTQPLHFITVFGIGLLICAVIVAIVYAGVRNQVAQRQKNSLTVSDDKFVLNTEFGASVFAYEQVASLTARRGLRAVRNIDLRLSSGKSLRLEGYENMDELAVALQARLPAEHCALKSWYQP